MPPLGVEVSLIGQTALHDVFAVVGTRSSRGYAAAVGTVSHLHYGPCALLAQRHLRGAWIKINIKHLEKKYCFAKHILCNSL